MKKNSLRLSYKQSVIALTAMLSTFVPLSAHAVVQNSYSFKYAVDPYVNVPVMKVFMPDGWKLNVTSDW